MRLDGVTKRFGDRGALDDAWLTVGRGEFMTLLGSVRCVERQRFSIWSPDFLAPDRGEIFIDGASRH